MRAIKIDSINRTITIIDVGNYRNICTELNEVCQYFICPMIFDTNDVMYADYYAGLNQFKGGFMLDGWTHPVLGNAIIVGTDTNGNLADVLISKGDIDKQISFISKYLVNKWFYYEQNLDNKVLFSKN